MCIYYICSLTNNPSSVTLVCPPLLLLRIPSNQSRGLILSYHVTTYDRVDLFKNGAIYQAFVGGRVQRQ